MKCEQNVNIQVLKLQKPSNVGFFVVLSEKQFKNQRFELKGFTCFLGSAFVVCLLAGFCVYRFINNNTRWM